MFARSVLRASSRASARSVPSIAKVARVSITSSAKLRADPFVPQDQIPTSSYAGGEVQRSTLTVGGLGNDGLGNVDRVVPLSREVYNNLPRNMQRMTLMDKVVVVTG
jgi:hypothetical protein